MPHPELVAQSAQFPKGVQSLAPGIWGAIGYAASNVYAIEGAHSLTIVDTTESTKAAENILTDLRAVTDKPVGRLIYTHSHRDHISGSTVFAGGAELPIWAAAGFASDLVAVDASGIAPNAALMRRTQAQFGIGLPPEGRISLGVGPGDRPMQGLGAGYLPPTHWVEADLEVDLDGVAARLILAPGETADHMLVWLPERGVLVSGDNWYHAFPNLYAIRGTPYRDFAAWADSLDQMAAIGADVLAPGHTAPVRGAAQVRRVLTTTRDAIRHVMRETARGMDAGRALDDIVADLTLPSDLADLPWLREFYGKLGWSARAFAAGTLGWYDGNPTHLGTLSSAARAGHLARLAGGVAGLWQAARDTDDLQWRMELCDHLIALGEAAEGLKADTMDALAEIEINATARNTYLWDAARLRQTGAAT